MSTNHNPYLPSPTQHMSTPVPIGTVPIDTVPMATGPIVAAPDQKSNPTRRIPGYDLVELIGVGGFGEVWRARSRATASDVAIKCVPVAGTAEIERAIQEAALLADLRHPHLITLLEAIQVPGVVALVMELAERGSLAQLLDRRQQLTPGETITVVAPVAAAVAHAHGAGVVHGDITPANVLFSQRGDALLADLGTARVADSSSRHAAFTRRSGGFTGGFADGPYLPTATDDVFGLGVLAYRCLTGAEPAGADQQRHALAGLVTLSGLSTDLADAVLRALSPDPITRGTAADFALAVRASGVAHAVDFGAGEGRPVGPARPAPTRLSAVPRRPEHAKRGVLSRVRGVLLG
jgi:serine/threonine protein kinase